MLLIWSIDQSYSAVLPCIVIVYLLHRCRELTEKVVSHLVRHTFAEDAYVYPFMHRTLPDCVKMFEVSIAFN